MIITGGMEQFEQNLIKQLHMYWTDFNASIIKNALPEALIRMESLLNGTSSSNTYVWKTSDETTFSPMNSVQYSIFLYLLSNTLYHSKDCLKEAEVVYYLNKIMHSCDWFYAIDLPNIFFAEHPLGSVMGRAKYGNNFFFYQGCTVGGNINRYGELTYPVLGNNVLMYANSSVLGNCNIGNHVIISAGSQIINQDIPSSSIAFGTSPNLTIKHITDDSIQIRLNRIFK